jgi:2,3-bisphosphoglycerate-independent phosphoglycerate mutase
MTEYDKTFEKVNVLFDNEDISQTLGQILSDRGMTQLRIAETEKYPHVTYFFSGGREQPFPGEERVLIPSPKVTTYDLQPEMSAVGVTDAAIQYINEHTPDFICLNYANADMVGHTGVFVAAIRAIETVDTCLGRLLDAALAKNYGIIIIADHGNADTMINPDGSPNTAHTMNPVPVIYVSNHHRFEIHNGKLADLAPTILFLLGVSKPDVMTGNVLLSPL